MLNEILSALDLVLQWQNILAIFVGVSFGVFMGAIPGLTGSMGIALMIPITYTLEPVTAFAILLGTYKGAMFGGAIPAILINTPGTPAAAATVIDGYPMAQKGQGSEAVEIALWSSVIADIIATIALIFGAVFLARIATIFGPAEYAVLILFSLTVIATVSGDSLNKGILMTLVGFIFAMVGLDPIAGTERLTFGHIELVYGVSIMSMLIGLFAVSEILLQLEQKEENKLKDFVVEKTNKGMANVKRCLPTILRGSFIGIFLGAIPGLGSAPAAFLSYNETKRKAKNPEKFGKGVIEGVAAPESANNATCGGALIPLMALGIPGDVITAILLGAFMIHGLTPGATMFSKNIGDVYMLFIVLLIASALLPFIGLLATRLFTTIVKVSRNILYPTIMIMCILGVYAFGSSFTDVWVMIFFGVLGYGLRKLNYPITPLLIGFVLEPIGETSVRQALIISDGNWSIFVSSGLSIFFVSLTMLSVAFVVYREMNKKKQNKAL